MTPAAGRRGRRRRRRQPAPPSPPPPRPLLRLAGATLPCRPPPTPPTPLRSRPLVRQLLALLLLLLLPLPPASAAPPAGPAAPPLVFLVDRGQELLLRLAGFVVSGHALATTVLSLPGGSAAAAAALTASASASVALTPALPPAGALFELSQLFVTQGLQPRRGRLIAAAPLTLAAAAGNRLLFVAPACAPPLGAWANFSYRVSDGPQASAPGLVFLVPPHGRLAHSDFRADLDGWRVAGRATLSREGFSRGLLSQYMVATDAAVQAAGARGGGASGKSPPRRGGAGGDANLWRFVAPPQFLGNKVGAFGGTLAFTTGAFAGDFAADQLNVAAPLATLECASCRGGQGVRLGFFAAEAGPGGAAALLDGKTKKVSVPLLASAWRRDPRNSLLAWPAVADCELVQVLSALSQLTILGDWTSWYETVALDDVMLSVEQPFGGIPKSCLM